MTQAQPIRRSSREPEVLRSALQSWLSSRVGVATGVSDVTGTDANGMSSDTVLFRARWIAFWYYVVLKHCMYA